MSNRTSKYPYKQPPSPHLPTHHKTTMEHPKDPQTNEITQTTETAPHQTNTTPSPNATPTIRELMDELAELEGELAYTPSNRNRNLRTRIRSLKKTIEEEKARMQQIATAALYLMDNSTNEAEGMVLDDVDAGEQAGEQAGGGQAGEQAGEQ